MKDNKPYFKIQPGLLDLDCVKNYLAARPDLNIQGLSLISRGCIRIFFYKTIEGKRIMSSELIEY